MGASFGEALQPSHGLGLTPMRSARAFLLLPLFALVAWQEAATPKATLELVYLANEGFLARSGEHTILIDAFVTEPYGGYAAVPEELFAALVAGEGLFADVDLALASHSHADHFQPAAAAEFLHAHSELPFLSSPQVIAALEGQSGHALGEATRPLLPGKDEVVSASAGGMRVELLRLPHSGGTRTASVENLGHLVELGGVRLLHVGDADLERDELAAYDLAERKIDVALIPYWWLGDANDLAKLRARVGAQHLVAVHVPPAEVAREKERLAQLDPSILVFEKAGESRTLTLER
jgi:L-ascorbate metabolism protein UlaG (beta-lactamase superfamily)